MLDRNTWSCLLQHQYVMACFMLHLLYVISNHAPQLELKSGREFAHHNGPLSNRQRVSRLLALSCQGAKETWFDQYSR